MKSNLVAGMMFALGRNVGGLRFFNRRVIGDVFAPVKGYARPPSVTPLGDAKNAGGLVVAERGAFVLSVDGPADISQVGDGVIRRVAVDVINVCDRPGAMHVQPREPVKPVKITINARAEITAFNRASNAVSNSDASIRADKPRKAASFRVVVNKFAQSLRGKIGLSHEALQLLIGQRPACVGAHGGLRYFIGSAA